MVLKIVRLIILPCLILSFIPQVGFSQNPAATAPVSDLIPSTWEKYQVGRSMVVSRRIDRDWINKALIELPPILHEVKEVDFDQSLSNQRDLLVAKICKDFVTMSPQKMEQYLDKTVRLKIASISQSKTTNVYYVMTEETIKQAILGGWKSEFFKYDQERDQLNYSRSIQLDSSESVTIIPATFNGADAEVSRIGQLQNYVNSVENAIRSSKNMRSSATFISLLADFLQKESFNNVMSNEDQKWFSEGLSYVLSIRYLSEMTTIESSVLYESTNSTPLPAGIKIVDHNLLLPLDTSSLKDEAIPAYREARRRKAVAVLYEWYFQGGRETTTELLELIERSKPADGETLIRLIKEVSGKDLTAKLSY